MVAFDHAAMVDCPWAGCVCCACSTLSAESEVSFSCDDPASDPYVLH